MATNPLPMYVYACLALASSILYVVIKGWHSRTLFYRLKKQGLVSMLFPWMSVRLTIYSLCPLGTPSLVRSLEVTYSSAHISPSTLTLLFTDNPPGHLLVVAPYLAKFPWGIHQTWVIAEIAKRFPKSDHAFYLDLWPFSHPLLVISSPELTIQACQEHDLSKPAVLKPFFHPFAGGDNLFVTNGPEWKHASKLFTPGFNANYLLTQMGHIVEEASVFVEILREHAFKGDIFSLDRLACDFTMDIIGAVSINARLNYMRKFNPLAAAMRSQVLWQ
jgi:hypothetical protein